jgi:transposase
MERYTPSAMERAMRVQEVILKAMSGELYWFEAAEILGVTCRTMRRVKLRYQKHGYDGLVDHRRRDPSLKRVPLEQAQRVLRLYREEYAGWNVRHFHEKLAEEHEIRLSYTWVKQALQGAGLVAKGRRRQKHRQRRERRPMRGMMVFCDGSTHDWFGRSDGHRQDLMAFLDDATGEVLSAFLVEEEGTLPVLTGLHDVVRNHGLFCSFYTDRGSHFFHTPKAGGQVDRQQLTQVGRALQQLGIEHIASYSPQGRGRMERFFRTWQGRLPQELRKAGIADMAAANQYIRRRMIPWHNRRLAVAPADPTSAFTRCTVSDLDAVLCLQHERVVQNDNTVLVGTRTLQVASSVWRSSFAKCRVRVCEHLDGTLSIRFGPKIIGRYSSTGRPLPAATSVAA